MSLLDDAKKEAYARQTTSQKHTFFLELRHPLFTSPIRFANHDVNIENVELESTAPENAGEMVTFIGVGFRTPKEPDLGTQPDNSMRIQIDGVSGAVHAYLKAAKGSGTPVEATLRRVLFDIDSGATVIQSALHLQTRDIELKMTTVLLEFGYTNPANQRFPRDDYTLQSNPGLAS